MRRHTPEHRRGLSRRAVLGAAMMFAAAPAIAADHPSIAYMKQFAKEMLNAHRQGTVGSFRKVIERHADVAAIADYSLGQYRKKLPAGQKQRYYGGVVTFMSRYFADQSRIYPIAKYEIGDAAAHSVPVGQPFRRIAHRRLRYTGLMGQGHAQRRALFAVRAEFGPHVDDRQVVAQAVLLDAKMHARGRDALGRRRQHE